MCAAPSYLERIGTPQSIEDLEIHNCLPAGQQEHWRLEGPDQQQHQVRIDGSLTSNSAEFTREALLTGLGIGLRSTWDVGAELKSGTLQIVLPEYRGNASAAVFAVYPSRDFMPAKVNVFIEFLSELYGLEPRWDRDIDLAALAANGGGAPDDKVTPIRRAAG